MSKSKLLPVPEWVKPEDKQEFALRLAAQYHSMGGSLGDLSEAIGASRSMLHMAIKGAGISAQVCIDLEKLLGRERFPREFFRPDLFIAE